MSRTIRNRHKSGRDYTIDIDAEIRYMEMLFDGGRWWYRPERIASYTKRNIRFNRRLYRDGFHSVAWKKRMKHEQSHTNRANWREFFAAGDWDKPYPHMKEATDRWNWD